MAQKFLDAEGIKYLWSKISMEDYPNNETLIAILKAIDETKQNVVTGEPGQFVVIGDDGNLVAQTMSFNTYYKGTTDPDNSLGEDGDLYLVKG